MNLVRKNRDQKIFTCEQIVYKKNGFLKEIDEKNSTQNSNAGWKIVQQFT